MEQLGRHPNEFQQLRIRACLIWARAYYTCTPLHHVHTKQDTDSKENWKLSGKVQETDGTEKVYVTHSLASKFDSPYSNTSSYSTANVTSWNMQTQALTRCRNLYSGSQLRILKHASLYLYKIPLLEWTLQRRLLGIAINITRWMLIVYTLPANQAQSKLKWSRMAKHWPSKKHA